MRNSFQRVESFASLHSKLDLCQHLALIGGWIERIVKVNELLAGPNKSLDFIFMWKYEQRRTTTISIKFYVFLWLLIPRKRERERNYHTHHLKTRVFSLGAFNGRFTRDWWKRRVREGRRKWQQQDDIVFFLFARKKEKLAFVAWRCYRQAIISPI